MLLFPAVLGCMCFLGQCFGEVFTAMRDMESLLDGESIVVKAVDDYIAAEHVRLNKLKEMAREYGQRNMAALNDGTSYLSNPVNAFLMIKRLSSSWEGVETLMKYNFADDFIQNISNSRTASAVKFPSKEDLDGAAVALLRLQDTYKIPTRDIAEGKIKDVISGRDIEAPTEKLSIQDCFDLCRIAYNQQDYYHTLMWAEEAINRIKSSDNPELREEEVLEYLAYSLFQQGNTKRALYHTKRLYKLDPDHPRAEGNIKYYEDLLKQDGLSTKTSSEADLPPVQNKRKDSTLADSEFMAYEELCRNEGNAKGAKYEASLHCYYKNTHPVYGAYIRLAPLKAEVMHWKPKIVIFKNVIHEYEFETLKELAGPKLKRATVKDGNKLVTVQYRIAKSAWLKDYDHPVVSRINKRIDLMTNLNMDTAEELQMANYGIGGHYEPHFDMSTRGGSDPYSGGTGNRVATLLFYLEAPEVGGATIFNRLKLSLFPVKFAAAFWHNLRHDGEPDLSTRHAACPVLVGQKWVANKWIHERGQEFRRKCDLDEDFYE